MDKIISDKINSLVKQNDKLIIAIEGSCASGKTTLSRELKEIYDCNVFHMDDFFLPFEIRTEERLSEVGGNIDYERFQSEIANKIKSDEPFVYGKFNCSTGKIDEEIKIYPKQVNIVEGVYSLHPKYDDIYNLKIFLEITEEEKLIRLKTRCPEKLERFINEWIPKENDYFDAFKIKEKCDLIIDNN